MTKEEREVREQQSLFGDERYAKKAWKKLFSDGLQSTATMIPEMYDNKGNLSQDYLLYQEAYNNVDSRLKSQGLDRPPMKAEIIVETNLIRAALDTSTFNLVLDRTAGKVREEISVGVGQFEELTDDELMLLAEHRSKAKDDK